VVSRHVIPDHRQSRTRRDADHWRRCRAQRRC
jgi:hypothetical protein